VAAGRLLVTDWVVGMVAFVGEVRRHTGGDGTSVWRMESSDYAYCWHVQATDF
jgi:hypothetical protein